jgi:hypothetical protein
MGYVILVLAIVVSAAGQMQEIPGERIRAHVKLGSNDGKGGRREYTITGQESIMEILA